MADEPTTIGNDPARLIRQQWTLLLGMIDNSGLPPEAQRDLLASLKRSVIERYDQAVEAARHQPPTGFDPP